ncbi:uncharacterized protein PGTG_12511 [Puccinia graminis f. sp. tritici CRL 75-36-700-3]|uniref:Alpha 1,2-mannosyltransferase 2.4.1 n=1 Tax=Puccinia graminis f. sp. tritici (strain CRL 75-36-700-3 / race SCCL) TaxID=418459 RepID=E3KUW4_PUCGT|nr:uncharacterized protein PGTG_12511 [Puccinia graminis f. sp. tritici CRL 75-36-700-3]EFP88064.2 hypothetical protein PGTG_12511 [Puccinia graminis f. sp. tritici CRL 75-36-700-3]
MITSRATNQPKQPANLRTAPAYLSLETRGGDCFSKNLSDENLTVNSGHRLLSEDDNGFLDELELERSRNALHHDAPLTHSSLGPAPARRRAKGFQRLTCPEHVPYSKTGDTQKHVTAAGSLLTMASNPASRPIRAGERDLSDLMISMRTVEDRINRKFGYPWVFLGEEPFSLDFRLAIKSMTRSQVFFGLIPPRQLSYPSHVDRPRATRVQKTMDNDSQKSRHEDNQSRRHISRFHSGFFFRHPLMLKFDYYWRVEPGIQYYCDVDYDPFVFMEENKKVYSFSVSLMEYQSTIPSLWKTVQGFVRANPDLLAANSSIDFLLKDPSQGIESDYNLCHFWSNFEVGDMRFWRSSTYAKFFAHLDRAGGIYYERWAEGPIHSIAAALFLRRQQIHQWDDIGYFQTPFSHCPSDYERFHSNGKCFCDPFENFDQDPYSCAPLWWELDRKKIKDSKIQSNP